MVDRGVLTIEQAAHHPDANRITRALGMAQEVEAEVRPQAVAHVPGDTFVLCSDGLSDLVEDREILEVVAAEPPAQAAGKLVDLANARGGHDNITVVVARAREAAQAVAGGVAPTVAETPTVAPATVPAATAPVRTLVEPGPPVVVIPPAPERPVPSARAARPRAHPVVVAGVVLAVAAFALLASVLVVHILERGGKRSGTGAAPAIVPSAAP